MTRNGTRRRRTNAMRASSGLAARTLSASALAGGCLAVVALWKTASGQGAATADPTR
jgi:hypothetical protein